MCSEVIRSGGRGPGGNETLVQQVCREFHRQSVKKERDGGVPDW